MTTVWRSALLVAAAVLIAAACGNGEAAPTQAPATTDAPATGDLPPDPAGACLEGDRDCRDIPGGPPAGPPPGLEEEPGAGPGDGDSGVIVGGGLSVSEALETDAVGVVAVQGFVVADGEDIRLCGVLAESLPPQCGGASIPLSGLDTVDPDELQTADGVTWTDVPVTILGEIADGKLVATPASA